MAEKKESKIRGNSLGSSGFTLSILSILSLGLIGVVMSILGFIFCFIQQRKKPTRLGKVGIILSVVGFVLSLVWIFYFAPIINQLLQSFPTA
ncbi:Uncharacterised protein [uncultured archaeon]|nr:Uncharacterised protein [uncultured archaeon]